MSWKALRKKLHFEDLMSKFLPYYLPFISKRKRVKIRSKIRSKWRVRLNDDLCKLLSSSFANATKGLEEPTREIKWYDWEWEVETNNGKKNYGAVH